MMEICTQNTNIKLVSNWRGSKNSAFDRTKYHVSETENSFYRMSPFLTLKLTLSELYDTLHYKCQYTEGR